MPGTPDFKSTLNLPKTDFGMKANLGQLEPKMLARWDQIGLYRKLLAQNADGPLFVFHDGPPYANGHLHIGHFLNKVLKDIVVKFHNLQGELCDNVPGWDCHGLPIELNVDKELGSKKREMSKVQIRQACRAYAQKFVDIQREEFKRLGVFARWDEPYLTMSYDYEAQTVRELAKFTRAGVVYRGKKPVHWCMQDQTALAEAEVEYDEHTSPTIYVAFPGVGDFGDVSSALKGKKVELVIWTTTPWTLPANLAISVHPDFQYVAYDLKGRVVIVAKELLAKFLSEVAPDELAVKDVKLPGADGESAFSTAALKDPTKILGFMDGKSLENKKYKHVLFDREGVVILGEHVTLEAGTGLVHTAPGHGMDDYIVGLKYGLPVLAPVDNAGRFTEEAGEWKGQKVFEANPLIIQKLVDVGALLSDPKASFKHQYPVCWRCKKPIIFRATAQWFVSMQAQDLRQRCLEEIEKVEWIPKWGRDRIFGMLENRPDWCISRQRTWGVPIPILYCDGCNTEVLDADLMDRVAGFMEKEGADAWYAHEPADFLTPGQTCAKCGGTSFRKEGDILDVWFDSGVSYAAVAEKRPNLRVPVDLYLEGSDQHRGWFHSALMCSVATRNRAPYKSVLTHGFVVDDEGKKYSKSNPKYVPPEKLIAEYGAEIVRLWVASTDYRGDIQIGKQGMATLAEGYRKIRNTVRYALSNLYDFDPSKDAVAEAELLPLDRWALNQLRALSGRVLEAYRKYEFHLVFHAILDFCSTTLSATYFDINKDRLYTGRANGKPRRSAQTVVHAIARDLLRLLAPVLSFTADEAWQHLPGEKAESVFLAGLPKSDAATGDAATDAELERLFAVRAAVTAAIEPMRRDKVVGSGLEARVTITATAELLPLLKKWEAELPTLFIVSQVALAPAAGDAVSVAVERARGEKCPRCWTYEEGLPADGSAVCKKCKEALAA